MIADFTPHREQRGLNRHAGCADAPNHGCDQTETEGCVASPFARMIVVPDLNQGPEVIAGYPRGRTRFTFTFTLDAHAEKTFRIGRARVAGILEAFNLLNTRNEVEEDVLTTTAFRTTTAVQPPRAMRAAIRVGF